MFYIRTYVHVEQEVPSPVNFFFVKILHCGPNDGSTCYCYDSKHWERKHLCKTEDISSLTRSFCLLCIFLLKLKPLLLSKVIDWKRNEYDITLSCILILKMTESVRAENLLRNIVHLSLPLTIIVTSEKNIRILWNYISESIPII